MTRKFMFKVLFYISLSVSGTSVKKSGQNGRFMVTAIERDKKYWLIKH